MDFSFTEEQELFRKAVREFSEKDCAFANEIDEKGEIPQKVLEDMASLAFSV